MPSIRTLRTVVKPDKVMEYMALIRDEVMPAAKKSGVKWYSVARVRYGAASSEFISVMGMDSWADLDGESPVVKGMGGREAYVRFVARITPLTEHSQYDIYRFQPELSYLPEK